MRVGAHIYTQKENDLITQIQIADQGFSTPSHDAASTTYVIPKPLTETHATLTVMDRPNGKPRRETRTPVEWHDWLRQRRPVGDETHISGALFSDEAVAPMVRHVEGFGAYVMRLGATGIFPSDLPASIRALAHLTYTLPDHSEQSPSWVLIVWLKEPLVLDKDPSFEDRQQMENLRYGVWFQHCWSLEAIGSFDVSAAAATKSVAIPASQSQLVVSINEPETTLINFRELGHIWSFGQWGNADDWPYPEKTTTQCYIDLVDTPAIRAHLQSQISGAGYWARLYGAEGRLRVALFADRAPLDDVEAKGALNQFRKWFGLGGEDFIGDPILRAGEVSATERPTLWMSCEQDTVSPYILIDANYFAQPELDQGGVDASRQARLRGDWAEELAAAKRLDAEWESELRAKSKRVNSWSSPPKTQREDFLEGIISPAPSHGCVYGASGVGKTFTVGQLAITATTSNALAGHALADCGSALIVAGEGADGIGQRLRVATDAQGIDSPPPIAITCRPYKLDQKSEREALEQFIDDDVLSVHGSIGLIIIDTLRTNSTINDREDSQVSSYMRTCAELAQKYNAVVLIVHHPAKGNRAAPAGAYSMTANADFLIRVSRTGPSRCEWLCEKLKDGEEGGRLKFELREHTVQHEEYSETSLVAHAVDPQDKPVEENAEAVAETPPAHTQTEDPEGDALAFDDQVLAGLHDGLTVRDLRERLKCRATAIADATTRLAAAGLIQKSGRSWVPAEDS